MKPQIVFIHGGDSFSSNEDFYAALQARDFDPYTPEYKKWRDWLKVETSNTHEFQFLLMPCAWNADYTAWKIWFGKLLPFLRDDAILIGHSLGGGFLLRYLTENTFPVLISQLHLVAPCVEEVSGGGDFKIELAAWSGFRASVAVVHLWHSHDDVIVPIEHSKRFAGVCPSAVLHTFENRGHFLDSTFPELLAVVQA